MFTGALPNGGRCTARPSGDRDDDGLRALTHGMDFGRFHVCLYLLGTFRVATLCRGLLPRVCGLFMLVLLAMVTLVSLSANGSAAAAGASATPALCPRPPAEPRKCPAPRRRILPSGVAKAEDACKLAEVSEARSPDDNPEAKRRSFRVTFNLEPDIVEFCTALAEDDDYQTGHLLL